MKKIIKYGCYTLLSIVFFSCSHKRTGEIVMDKEGNYYELRECFPNEGYILDKVDTTKFKVVGFNNR